MHFCFDWEDINDQVNTKQRKRNRTEWHKQIGFWCNNDSITLNVCELFVQSICVDFVTWEWTQQMFLKYVLQLKHVCSFSNERLKLIND